MRGHVTVQAGMQQGAPQWGYTDAAPVLQTQIHIHTHIHPHYSKAHRQRIHGGDKGLLCECALVHMCGQVRVARVATSERSRLRATAEASTYKTLSKLMFIA